MAGVLLFFTAIAITYWALIPVAVVVVGGLRYVVSKLVRSSQSQSAKIVKEGLSFSLSISLAYAGGLFRMVVIRARNLLAGANFIPAKNSSRSIEDQWLASCNSYLLPEDLVIDQILSRLPVKSLMRFKSVCKRWHSLPTNPSFIASHLKHINTHNRLASWNGNDKGLIVSHDGFHVFSVRDIASFQPVNLKFGFDRKADLVLGPCDGIFCLYWRPIERFGSAAVPRVCVERLPTIVLWNPATRAFSILPMSKFDFPPHKKVSDCMVGFGFDLKSKSIKVVKVVTFCRSEDIEYDYVNCAEVYDLSSGSWRVLHVDDVPQNVFVSNDLTDSMYNSNDGVFHWHSCLRWSSIDEESLSVELVLSFDMSTELFHVTLLPKKFNTFYFSLNYEGRECYLSLLGDSLAVNFSVFKKDECHSIVEVWVMKKDFDRVVEAGVSFSSYSWSHELTVELSDPTPLVLMGFWSKNELRMLERECFGETLFLYDYVTKQARDLQLSGELNFLYRESLVSVKGGCGNGQFVFK